MFKKLEEVERRYDEINHLLSQQNTIQDQKLFTDLSREFSNLTPIVEHFREYKQVVDEVESTQDLLSEEKDAELKSLAKSELTELEARRQKLEGELKILLLPKDPNDEKNVILELRAGTGGDEAGIFVGDVFSMYQHYANTRGWQLEILSASLANMGGYKEVIALIKGDKVYSRLKYESGVHRVQRVPKTETQGRIHTSTITVAILPEVEELEVQIKPEEIRVDVYRSSGPGGQSVNTTDSAVRVTHLPTGLVVACQDEKSQHKNKSKALKILNARLYDLHSRKQEAERAAERKSQVGTGDRSERIRTYNFPQGRVTDHRIGLTLYQLEFVMGGKLDPIIDPLIAHHQAEALKGPGVEL